MWYAFCAKSMILIDRIVTLRGSLPVRGAWIEMLNARPFVIYGAPSLPVRGAWIEISVGLSAPNGVWSLPVRGAWIEMVAEYKEAPTPERGRSPCGERGLKFQHRRDCMLLCAVAPRAGSVD